LDGEAEVVERERGTASEAQALLSAWERHYGDDLEDIQWRYEKIKEIGRRSVPRRAKVAAYRYDLPADDPAPPAGRVGRNDPCPCGSGKKFKRCCWLKKNVSSRPR
jgi:preprotein translocase subunit SecA